MISKKIQDIHEYLKQHEWKHVYDINVVDGGYYKIHECACGAWGFREENISFDEKEIKLITNVKFAKLVQMLIPKEFKQSFNDYLARNNMITSPYGRELNVLSKDNWCITVQIRDCYNEDAYKYDDI